jgi:hypothetical protein
MLEKAEGSKGKLKDETASNTRGLRPRRPPIASTDPFRPITGGERPGVEAVARGVLEHPTLMAEIVRRLAFVEPETLDLLAEQIAIARAEADTILKAIREGTFGRDFIAGGVEGDPSRLDIAAGNAAVAHFQRTGKIPPLLR